MIKYCLFFLFHVLALSIFSQDTSKIISTSYTTSGDQIQIVLDSLKLDMLSKVYLYGKEEDSSCVSLKIKDPRFVPQYKRLKQSPLFIIGNKKGFFFYKFLATSDSTHIVEFINEYFKPAIITSVTIVSDCKASRAIYGRDAYSGSVIISFNKNASFNPKIAGLTELIRLKRPGIKFWKKRRFSGSNY